MQSTNNTSFGAGNCFPYTSGLPYGGVPSSYFLHDVSGAVVQTGGTTYWLDPSNPNVQRGCANAMVNQARRADAVTPVGACAREVDEVASKHGWLLELAFCRGANGHTVLRSLRQHFPLRTTVPFHLDGGAPEMAFVYVENPMGGVFAGDRLLTSVTADPGVRVHLTTPSATKLYRMDGGYASHELRLELGMGAYVESIPDALITRIVAEQSSAAGTGQRVLRRPSKLEATRKTAR